MPFNWFSLEVRLAKEMQSFSNMIGFDYFPFQFKWLLPLLLFGKLENPENQTAAAKCCYENVLKV